MTIKQRQGRFYVTLGTGADRFRASADNLIRAEFLESQELTKRGLYPTRNPVVTKDSKALVAHKEAGDNMTLGKLLDIAIKTKWHDHKSKDNLVSVANKLFSVLDHRMHPKDVTTKVMREAAIKLSEMGNSGATINRKLSTLSVLLNIAVEDEWIVNRPKLPRRKESEHRIRFLTREEENRCFEWCEKRGATNLAEFIACAIDSGFRRAELMGVRHDQFYDEMLHLERGETKNNKARAIPCTDRMVEILERRRASGGTRVFEGYSNSQLRRHWEAMVSDLGFSDDKQFVVHMLRHTCASRLAIKGHNSAFIKMWCGHSSITTTEKYIHLSQETLKSGAVSLGSFRA